MEGVIRTRVGYAGADKKDPTYHDLGGNSETIEIDYDPAKISYKDLLEAFGEGHDPAHQSYSSQYKNILFYHDAEQKKQAEEWKARVEKATGKKVETEIAPYRGFVRAEDYHQKHALQNNPELMAEYKTIYPDFKGVVDSTAAARVNGYLAGYGDCDEVAGDVSRLGLSDAGTERLLKIVCRGRTIQGCGGSTGKECTAPE